MTNKFSKLALATAATLAASLGASNASAAPVTVNAQAKATVLRQLTITKQADLNFGTIVTGTVASTVVVDAAGGLVCGTGLTCSSTAPGNAARFTVTGTNNAILSVSVPTTVTLVSGSNQMTALVAAPATLALGNSGNTGTPLNFGGTLNVGASQADGVYSSVDFAVTVNYP